MKPDKTLPRKKRYDIEKLPEGRRKVVQYIMNKCESRNMTLEDFAKTSPGIPVATFGNYRNPAYIREINGRTYTRFADILSNIEGRPAEEIFNELIELAGLPKDKYQYNQSKKRTIVSEALIRADIFTKFLNLKIVTDTKEDYSFKNISSDCFSYNEIITTGNVYHDLVIDYTDTESAPIKYWVLDIYTGEILTKNVLKNTLYRIIVDGANADVKYSIVTDSDELYKEVAKISVPSLNIHLSCILYKDGKFKETYICTATDNSELKKAGLTQKNK